MAREGEGQEGGDHGQQVGQEVHRLAGDLLGDVRGERRFSAAAVATRSAAVMTSPPVSELTERLGTASRFQAGVCAVRLGWLPTSGYGGFQFVILPAVALGIGIVFVCIDVFSPHSRKLSLFAGTFFPVSQLPDWLEPVAWITPL